MDIASALGNTLDAHSLTGAVVTKLQAVFHVDRCSLLFVNREEGCLWTTASNFAQEWWAHEGVKEEDIVRLPLERGIVGLVAKTGQLINVRDAYQHPSFNQEVDRKTNYRTRSMLCGPIKNSKGEVSAQYIKYEKDLC